MIHETLHRKLKIEYHEPHMQSGASEGLAVPALQSVYGIVSPKSGV